MLMSRRGFSALASAGLCSALAPRVFAAPKGGKVTFGAQSYSFRDRPLEQAVEGMKTIGLEVCELWQGHVEPKGLKRDELRKWRLETPVGEFKKIADMFKKAKVKLVAYNMSFKDDYTEEEIDRGFVIAKALGCKAITASANQQVVQRVAPLAKKHKMMVAMHNHARIDPNEFAKPEDFENAMKGPGREFIGVNLDIGHFTAANFDAVEFLKKHHQKIVTLHIKDRKKDQGEATPFGQGDAPIKAVLVTLRDNKWNIPANIEYEYKGADSVDEVKKCLEYCKQQLA